MFETLGPVQKPIYSVKFATDAEAAEYWAQVGKEVYYAPKYSSFVYTQQIKAIKGSDASNWNDEEVDENEQEFSDDEAELEHKRRLKQKDSQRKKKEPPKLNSRVSAFQRNTSQPSIVSFGDLAGEDVAFLDQLAAADSRGKRNESEEDDDYEPRLPEDSKGTATVDGASKSGQNQLLQERKSPQQKAADILDEEPYHTLTRPTGLLLSTSQPPARQGFHTNQRKRTLSPHNSMSPGGEDGNSDVSGLSHSQKRRLRRKRKGARERFGDVAEERQRWSGPRDRGDNREYSDTPQRSQTSYDNRSQPPYGSGNSFASRPTSRDSHGSFSQQHTSSVPDQYGGYSGSYAAPYQPNVQNFAQQLPPGAHINPAFLAQLAIQQPQPAPPVQSQPSYNQYQSQPSPLPPQQQQTQNYLNMLQAQLRQQLLTQAPVPPPQPAPVQQPAPPPIPVQSLQNQTQAQLQQQLQALLHQMQVNASQPATNGPAPATSVNNPTDAFAQVQYQLNVLGVLGQQQQQQQQPPGPNIGGPQQPHLNDPRRRY